MAEAKVRLCLDELWQEHHKCLKHLECIVAPTKSRAVHVTKAFEPNALVLVPLTTTISAKKETDSLCSGAVRLQHGFTNPDTSIKYDFVLIPSGGFRLEKAAAEPAAMGGFASLKAQSSTLVVPTRWLEGPLTGPSIRNNHT